MGVVIPLLTTKTERPGELYPFSNFPMYSSFQPETYYVYVTDLGGKPIAIGPLFGRSPGDVKKVYDRKLEALKPREKGKRKLNLSLSLKAEAAEETLRWIQSVVSTTNKPKINTMGGLRLHEVIISYRDGVISKTDALVGELDFSQPSIPSKP
jgi:hypothetical protein